MGSRKKIVFVITGTGIGGAEKMMYYTIKGLDPKRYDVRLCSLKKKGLYAQRLEAEGIGVYSPGMTDADTARAWFDAIRVIILLTCYFLKEKPDIVHSWLFRANIITRIAARFAGVPLVISSVRVMGGESRINGFLERLTAFLTDHYVAVSAAVKAHIVRIAGISESKVSVIYNGIVGDDKPLYERKNLMRSLSMSPDDKLLMTAGRLHYQKGFDCLIQAMAALRSFSPRLQLLIAGEGEAENELKKLARTLELSDTIHFLGLRDDVTHLLHCIDIFILPSRWEGLPNVILEAMAAEKPVIATAVGGIPELVIPGVTGLLVPPRDVPALARTIEQMMSDPARLQAMGAAGRERVKRCFSMEAMIAKTETLYQTKLKPSKHS